jgi:ribosomal protein S18 acetylase RimI-like enzyme
MNMFAIEEEYRGQGLGTQVAQFWEEEMKKQGYDMLLTSTQSNERAQHLYRRLGYKDCGGLLLPFPDEVLELVLAKKI